MIATDHTYLLLFDSSGFYVTRITVNCFVVVIRNAGGVYKEDKMQSRVCDVWQTVEKPREIHPEFSSHVQAKWNSVRKSLVKQIPKTKKTVQQELIPTE